MGNMTEKQTPSPENQPSGRTPNPGEAVTDEDIAMFNDWVAQSREAAQRTMAVEQPIEAPRSIPVAPPVPEAPEATGGVSARVRRNRAVAGTVVGAALVGGIGYGLHEEFKAPEFSEETTTYTVDQGEGVFAAAQHVKGVEDLRDAVDYISADPANTDVLKDGLQPGEQLVIPVSVKGFEENK